MKEKTEASPSAANTPRNSAKRPLPPQLEANKWKPGCPSPNPSGRPKTKPLTDQIRQMVDERSEEELRAFRDNLWRKLNSERMVSPMILHICLDRLEGKLASTVTIDGALDIRGIMERGRKQLGNSELPILDAEEIPQLGDGKDTKPDTD